MINWNRRSYTREDFVDAWSLSNSYSDLCTLLGYTKSGGASRIFRETGLELGLPELESSRAYRPKMDLSEILVFDSPYKSTSSLRERLVAEGILPNYCSALYCPFVGIVPRDPFTGAPTNLRLALDHINGNNRDNRIENLRILCTHCHSLTDTWCVGKSKVPPVAVVCASVDCLVVLSRANKSGFCSPCATKNRNQSRTKIDWPSLVDLELMLESSSKRSVASLLGVSDVALAKHLRKHKSLV